MQQQLSFFLSIAFSFIAWGIVASRYIWPELRLQQRDEALRPLLLNAFYQANHAGLSAGQLGATYFIPTLIVPLLLITHGLTFRILLQHQTESAIRDSRHLA
jgi:hypothetical protein